MKKNIMEKIFLLFLILQPIIDLITSISVRFIDFPISFGIVIRGIFIVYLFIFLIFINKSKFRHNSLIFLGIYIISAILYFITKPELFNIHSLIGEIIYFFKYSYFVLSFVGLINFIDHYRIRFKDIENIMVINYIIVILSILIAQITHTSFKTYNDGLNGSMGWFFSGNEIGAFITIVFPLILLYYHEKKEIKYLAVIILSVIISLLVGTKTTFLGVTIPIILYLGLNMLKMNKKVIIGSILLLIVIFTFGQSTAIYKNFKNQLSYSKGPIGLLNGRDKFLISVDKIYKNAPIVEKITGVGFTNRKSINNKKINKLIEMDVFDIFYRYGILGTIVLLMPFVWFIYETIKKPYKKKMLSNYKFITLVYMILIAILVSTTAGHVLGAPMISLYVTLILIDLYKIKA